MQLNFRYCKKFSPINSNNVKVALLVTSNIKTAPIKIAYWLANGLCDEGFNVSMYWINDVKNGLFLSDSSCAQNKFKARDFDIVHSHMLRPDIAAFISIVKLKLFWLIGIKCKTKFISTIHSDIYQDLRSGHSYVVARVVSIIWLKLLTAFDKVVVLTENAKLKYKRLYKGKLTVVHNGIPDAGVMLNNLQHNLCIEFLCSQKDIVNVGCIASIRRIKGIDLLIKSLPFLPKEYVVRVAGEGTEKDNLIRLARSHEVDDRIFFHGHVDNIQEFILQCDMIVFPSRSEGFGLATLETMSLSKAALCSNIDTFIELFPSDKIPKFDLNNPVDLANSIKSTYLKRDEVGVDGRMLYETNFTDLIMVKNYLNEYLALIK